jgi:uncharacterized membrane protein
MKNIIFLFLFGVGVSCKPKDVSPINEIIGKWRLTSYAKKDINNTIQTTIIPANKAVFVSFSEPNKFEETYQNTKPIEYGFLSGLGTFSVEGENIRIVTYYMSCTCGMVFKVASLDKQKLILKNENYGEFFFEKSV